jgi:hypothetical protein
MRLFEEMLIDYDIFVKKGYIEYFNHCKKWQSVYDRLIVDFQHKLELDRNNFELADEFSLAMSFRRRYRDAISIMTKKSTAFLELEKLIKDMAEIKEIQDSKIYTVKEAHAYMGEIIE